MSLGLGLFLSTIVISLLLLYRSTHDRWNWKKGVKRICIWSGVILVILACGTWSYVKWKDRPVKQTGYYNLTLGMTKEEVVYVKGTPDYSLGDPDPTATGWRASPIVTSMKDDPFAYESSSSWGYEEKYGPRIDVKFDKKDGLLMSVGCYAGRGGYCDTVLGISTGSSEEEVLGKLGDPDKSEINGPTKGLYYYGLNVSLYLTKMKVYMITVGYLDPSKATSPSPLKSSTVPTYDSKGWTQENTNSTVAGPWLDYDPPGTRYCRSADDIIIRLYPPGIKPNAKPANPFCLGESQERPTNK